jgi:multidrug efflux system membrane fusion protein
MKKPLARLATPLLAGTLLLGLVACGQKPAEKAPERAVRTLVLQAGEAGQELVFAGELRARTESRLAFRVPGKVLERKVGLGDAVKKGQLLMRLDPADLQLAAEAAQAALRAAKANRDSQAADMKRFRELRDQGFISSAELERREAAFQAAVSQFEQARAQAKAQSNQKDYGDLLADASGVITSVDAEPGTVVAAGTPVLRLAQDGARDVIFQVPEQQVAALRRVAGSGRLSVVVPGLPDPLPAKLREVAQAADPVTRTFLVKADIGPQPEARIGQTATVTLSTEKVGGVVKLPMAAVFEAKGKPHVYVLDSATMTLKSRAIEVAGADGNEVIVASGLSAQQEVVSAGVHVLRDGEKVRRYGAAPQAAAAASR